LGVRRSTVKVTQSCSWVWSRERTIPPSYRYYDTDTFRPGHGPEIPEIPEILKSVLKCPEICPICPEILKI